MPDSELDSVIEKCAAAGLLGNVTLLGGEAFIDPHRLLRVIRKIWRMGCGTSPQTAAGWPVKTGKTSPVNWCRWPSGFPMTCASLSRGTNGILLSWTISPRW